MSLSELTSRISNTDSPVAHLRDEMILHKYFTAGSCMTLLLDNQQNLLRGEKKPSLRRAPRASLRSGAALLVGVPPCTDGAIHLLHGLVKWTITSRDRRQHDVFGRRHKTLSRLLPAKCFAVVHSGSLRLSVQHQAALPCCSPHMALPVQRALRCGDAES